MPSPAQIAADRSNAARSTGPRTPDGKATSRYNALKHGLYARDVVLPGEDRAAYEGDLAELTAAFKPQGRYERALVKRLADLWWRLGRSAAIEAGLLNPDWDGAGGPETAAGGAPSLAAGGGPLVNTFRVALDETATLDRLGRYEARLERAFKSTLGLLERCQARRRTAARDAALALAPEAGPGVHCHAGGETP